MTRRAFIFATELCLAVALAAILAAGVPRATAQERGTQERTAQERMPVVATFSILADLVRNIGGDRVAVTMLVPADGDAHVYSPTPADAKTLAASRVVFVNGLGFEGWLTRLVKASGTRAATVVASKGIKPRKLDGDDHGHGHGGHSHGANDPHAWQSVANVKLYVANIRGGLIAADPAGRAVYQANAAAYLAKLDALEKDIRDGIARIPPARRRVITSHDAFGYFGAAYGIAFVSPEGLSTESEASARDVAKIIAQVRKEKIPAVFLENIASARLLDQIAKESGARLGGTLYSDALSGPGGPAPTYLEMMRHNLDELEKALAG